MGFPDDNIYVASDSITVLRFLNTDSELVGTWRQPW